MEAIVVYSADDLLNKLKEIESIIRENTNADGTFRFDPQRVLISLELARKMAETVSEEKE
jgi:hypothetical protein